MDPAGEAVPFIVPEKPLKDDFVNITGLPAGMDPANNLVIKAIRMIREIQKIPFLRIHLHKAIPVGAGLGGGSSDASTFMNALNNHFGLEISNGKLKQLSAKLGSDCPFFIDCVPSFARGRGEMLTRVNPLAEGFHLLLVNPGIHINTREAYSFSTPGQPDSNLKELYDLDISKWKDVIINDFEVSIFKKHPQIAEIKSRLYNMGAVYSSMSGSGSTVYGIFRNKPEIPGSLKQFVIYSDSL